MAQATVQELKAMKRALDLAATPGPRSGPNPRVGCVLLSAEGEFIGEGYHRGAGHPHAEIEALRRVPTGTSPVTAVVTLEPCRHTGRTLPCVDALISSGIKRVVLAHRDPTPQAGGGAEILRDAGLTVIEQVGPELAARAVDLLQPWLFGLTHARPWVTWKVATTLDGRAAAEDGSSRWITAAAARAEVHRMRARHDVVLIGTGTALRDDPALTVRLPDGSEALSQPARAVMGLRSLPDHARLLKGTGPIYRLQTRDVHEALGELYRRGLWRVFLEGGGQLAAAFLRAGVVDEIVAYLAPALLGTGTPMIGSLGIGSMEQALRYEIADIALLPPQNPIDVRLTLRPLDKESSVYWNH